MKRKQKRWISVLLIVLLLITQLSTAVWAKNGGQEAHIWGMENNRKGAGYATSSDADQKEEGTFVSDDKIIGEDDELEDENAEKTVLRWEFVDDDNLNGGQLSLVGVNQENQANFETVVSMLPTQVDAFIADETEAVKLSIADWSCPEYEQDGEGQWPYTGEFEFTAKLPEGYVCDPAISVSVILGGAEVYTINDHFAVDGLSYKELGPDTVQLMGYDGEKPKGSLIIPDKVEKPANGREYKVVRIVEGAFRNCTGLTGDLVIPDTVTEIGKAAFERCNFMGELILSDSLVRIEDSVFHESGFTGELHLPDTLTYIGGGAFQMTGFTGRLILPEELTFIGNSAFRDCIFTGDLFIPDSVTYIGQWAFYDIEFKGRLTLPKELRVIERETFSNCKFTGELKLPDSITNIGDMAFENCDFTGKLVLPDGITSIEMGAFFNCSKLTGRLRIPDGVTRIGERAFDGTDIEGYDTGKQEVGDLLFDSGILKEKIRVEGQPFQPSADTGFQDGNMRYKRIGSDAVKLIEYSGDPDKDVFIPDTVKAPDGNRYSVTHIGEKAFFNQHITGSLRLPETLICIEKSAFSYNEFAGQLRLPETLTYIGLETFSHSGFTGDLTIPENVSYIGRAAFRNTGFTGNLIIKGRLSNILESTFQRAGFTGALSLPDTLTSIGISAFNECGFTGNLELPAGLETIGDISFKDCVNFIGVLSLPESVTEIGELAFGGCDGIDSVHIGPNLQKLGFQAFPESLPLSTDSPRVQLLLNTYLNQDAIADASWDGKEDVPDGAIASVKQDTPVTGDKRIGEEAVITVPRRIVLTVDGRLTVDGSLIVDGTILVEGTLIINGNLSGSGIILIGRNGKVEGNLSGFRIEYLSQRSSSRDDTDVNSNVLRGTWERTETGIWKFRQTTGIYAAGRWGIVDNLWYYFDGEGRMLTGWQFINNQWYYLCTEADTKTKAGLKEGAMVTGWHYDPAYQSWFYLGADGAMAIGWKKIDGKQYYFNPESDGTRGVLQ